MVPRSSAEGKSTKSAEEHADILNNLALNPRQSRSSSMAISISEGRRYPKRGLPATRSPGSSSKEGPVARGSSVSVIEQGVKPYRIATKGSGKLTRPSKSRVGVNGNSVKPISEVFSLEPDVNDGTQDDETSLASERERWTNATNHIDAKPNRGASAVVADLNRNENRTSRRLNVEVLPRAQTEEPRRRITKKPKPNPPTWNTLSSQIEVDENRQVSGGLGGNLMRGEPTKRIKRHQVLHSRRIYDDTRDRSEMRSQADEENSVSSGSYAPDVFEHEDQHNNEEAETPSNHEGHIEDGSRNREQPGAEALHIELYGQEPAWDEVLKGAEQIGVSTTGGSQTKILPRLENPVIRYIVRSTRSATRLLKRLLEELDMEEEDAGVLEARLETALADIGEKVKALDETAAGTKRSETAKDIYAHAIPSLVFLLRSALQYRTMDYAQPSDLEFLKSMISIQDTILLLCEKAFAWNAKAYHETPIVCPTRQIIRPCLRTVREAFQGELEHRKRLFAQRWDDRPLSMSHERLFESSVEEMEENARRPTENSMKGNEYLDRKHEMRFGPSQRERGRGSSRVGDEHDRGRSSYQVAQTDQWTDEQNLELMVQLQNPESRYLPGLRLESRGAGFQLTKVFS